MPLLLCTLLWTDADRVLRRRRRGLDNGRAGEGPDGAPDSLRLPADGHGPRLPPQSQSHSQGSEGGQCPSDDGRWRQDWLVLD